MRHKITLFLMMLLTTFLPVAYANSSMPLETIQKAKDIINQANISGMAIVKVDKGDIYWNQALGNREDNKELNNDTIFNAASLTKPVFAMLVMSLVAQDKLDLDGSLAQYWIDPDVSSDPRHKALTPRIILSHQSGLPNWRGKKGLSFMFQPGARHEYSGEGYEYLRRAIENKLNLNIATLTKEYVFGPAGMTSSSMGWDASLGNNIAKGYDEHGKPIDTAIMKRKPNAAANLMTTANDYARFLAWVSTGANLPSALFDEIRTPQALHKNPSERLGLGWKLIPLQKGDALFHDGREPGVRTYAVINPITDEGLAILTNSSNGDLAFREVAVTALSYGQALVKSADKLAWQYLHSLPSQAVESMSKVIARSPAFLNTFLQAANTNLIQQSGLSDDIKAEVDKAIMPLVLGTLKGSITPEKSADLVSSIIVENDGKLSFAKSLSQSKALEWSNKLKQHE